MKWLLGIVSLLIIVAGVALFVIPAKAPTNTNVGPNPVTLDDLIEVSTPLPNAEVVGTTLNVAGKARGSWYFEASFPYQLKDAQGNTIVEGPVKAQGDWMTTDYVPFNVVVTFPKQPTGSKGTLVLKNDNPSGDPTKDKSVSVSIIFK